jgi:hypothetical protein
MGLNIINWPSESDYQVFLDQKEIKVERLRSDRQTKTQDCRYSFPYAGSCLTHKGLSVNNTAKNLFIIS